MKTIKAAPKAEMLIESMRDIGYALETALADVIDNSITAQASHIDILTELDGRASRIGILDDGIGMTRPELHAAMVPGSRNPREIRNVRDLGRFGLGLKTASFSQCRRVTVVTRKYGTTSAAIWDLDFVAEVQDWLVQIPDDHVPIQWADRLGEQGTLVVWEKLDRLFEQDDIAEASAHFVKRIDDALEHLELVFHRFLAGEAGQKRIVMRVNGRPLEPFDPFHSGHAATAIEPLTPEVIKVGEHAVTIQTFTLPHHKKVSKEEWERYAGRAGYVKNQGFYVYRQKRLIIHGTWFGLARQTELTKLARVRIDMPNGMDADWKIDVKKASAQPPHQVRARLRRIIETIGATSRRVYATRGRILVPDTRLPVWNRVQDKNEISYRINEEHPVVAEFMEGLSEDKRTSFFEIIALLSSSLPMDALFADLGGAPDKVTGASLSDEALGNILTTTVDKLVQSRINAADIADMLRVTEPFRSNWERTEKLLESYDWGEGALERESQQS